MLNDLKGKKVLITGSTTGIGAALVLGFARYGAHIGINSHEERAEHVDKLIEEVEKLGGKAQFFQADLMKAANCEKLVDDFAAAFGGLDVLINNAGGLGGRALLEETTEELYDRVMDLNVRSALFVTKQAIKYLKQSDSASVISTGSLAGREGGGPGASIYGASKAWVHDAHRCWVKEYSKDNIRFNCVAPGFVDTVFHADKTDELKAHITSTIPLGKAGTPEDLVGAYLFLASKAMSGYITGQIIDLNGGMLMP